MPRNHLPSPDGVAGTKSPACDGTEGAKTVPRCKSAASAVRRIAKARSAMSQSRANGGASIHGHGAAARNDAPAGQGAWRRQRPSRGATYRAGRGEIPVVPEESGDARRRWRRMAGGPDVERHAAAAACDGEGTRVRGHAAHCAGSACLGSQGCGSPITTEHVSGSVPGRLARPRDASHPATRAEFPLFSNFGQAPAVRGGGVV